MSFTFQMSPVNSPHPGFQAHGRPATIPTDPPTSHPDELAALLAEAQRHYHQRNYSQSIVLLKHAAHQGSARAAVTLGNVYMSGMKSAHLAANYPLAAHFFLVALGQF